MSSSTTTDESTATLAGYLLSILPKFPAALSMFGSMLIISQVIRNDKNRRQMQQRIVAGMSGFDLMVSTVWFFTNFFVPQTMKRSQGFPFAFGNRASCDAQGFLVQVSIASVLYNASLSLYYLLALKYLWRDVRFRSIEKYFHLFPILFGLITAIIAVSMGLIGNADWDCWISPIENSRDTPDSAKLARIFQWVFFFGPLWISMSFAFFNMFQVYHFVKNLELRASTYRNSQEQTLHYKNLAKQNQLYAIAFLCTWLFPTIARLIQVSGGKVPVWLVVLSGTFIPLQGFFNSLVYFSTKFHNIRQAYKQKRWYWHLAVLIKSVIKNQEVNLQQEQVSDKNINKMRRGGKVVRIPSKSDSIEERNRNLASNVGMNGRSESIETNDVRFNTKERWNYLHGIDNETRRPFSANSGSRNVHASEIRIDEKDANFSSISESQIEDVSKGPLSLQSRSSGGLNRIESGVSLDSSKGSLNKLRSGNDLDPDTSLLEAFDPNSPRRRSTSLHILEEGDRSNENSSENVSQSVESSGLIVDYSAAKE